MYVLKNVRWKFSWFKILNPVSAEEIIIICLLQYFKQNVLWSVEGFEYSSWNVSYSAVFFTNILPDVRLKAELSSRRKLCRYLFEKFYK